MLTGKLFKNLRLLGKQHLNNFERFINSPYFLKRKNIPVLYKELIRYYPDFNIAKKDLYKKAFGGKQFNDVLLRKYFSELNNMLAEYLAVNSFQNDKWSYSSKLIDRLIELKNYDEAEKIAKETIADLEKNPLRNEKYYYNKYIFESYIKTISNFKTNLNPDTDWKRAMEGFVNYSALTVLQFYYIILNDAKFRQEKSSIGLEILNSLVKVYEENDITQNPMAFILNNLVKSFIEPGNEAFYRNIKEMILKHKGLLDKNELAAIYTYLHNYCFVKVDNGNLAFMKERFEVVKEYLANGLHLKDGYMVPDMYISMAMNALMMKEFTWAEDFIKKYKDHLPGEDKISNEYFAYSALNMFKGDFSKALEYLSRVKFKKYYDKFKIKAMMLMVFYEAEYYEQAFSQADTFRHFISKYKTVTPYVKERTSNFIKQVLQLIKYRLGETEKPEIPGFSTIAVMYRPWLTQKINQLKSDSFR